MIKNEISTYPTFFRGNVTGTRHTVLFGLMAHTTAKCHIYLELVKRSLKYISLTKCYDDMDSFRIFGIVLKYSRIYCVFVIVYRGDTAIVSHIG